MENKEDGVNTSERGDWSQSFTGVKFYPLNPHIEDINITDIAHALSLTCRYGGHCKFHYSVAQHSVLCASVAEPADRFAALMHDASEAYLSDIIRPFKHKLPEYQEAEARMMKIIAEKYGFEYPMSSRIKEIDNRMLLTEKLQLMKTSDLWSVEKNFHPYKNVVIEPMHPLEAEKIFIETFLDITGAIGLDAFEESIKKVTENDH